MTQVNTHEIKIGDLIKTHGVTFEITKLNNEKEDKYGLVKNFATKMVHDESNGFFPKSWMADYTIQGNQNAFWNKVA